MHVDHVSFPPSCKQIKESNESKDSFFVLFCVCVCEHKSESEFEREALRKQKDHFFSLSSFHSFLFPSKANHIHPRSLSLSLSHTHHPPNPISTNGSCIETRTFRLKPRSPHTRGQKTSSQSPCPRQTLPREQDPGPCGPLPEPGPRH
jgi:hypothetical protein